MIELESGLYIVQGDKYRVLLRKRNDQEVLQGRIIATREVRGDYLGADYLTGIVENIKDGNIVLRPAIKHSFSYAVDFGHAYEKVTDLEEARIPLKNIESIVGIGERQEYTN